MFFLNVTFMNDMKNFNANFGMFPRDFSKYLSKYKSSQEIGQTTRSDSDLQFIFFYFGGFICMIENVCEDTTVDR